METSKNDGDKVEARIADLEKELRPYIYPPLDREQFEKDVVALASKETGIIFEERGKHPELAWLEHLAFLKREKDKNSSLWMKIRNWD